MSPERHLRLNQYNWLGQKLLAQHRHEDILRLRENLTNQKADETDLYIGDAMRQGSRPLSDHLTYLSGLASMDLGTNLEGLIISLQKLSFQRNSQYFLLLCQCLFYLGHHDSVIALCKQVLNREISTISSTDSASNQGDEVAGKSEEELVKESMWDVTKHVEKGAGRDQWCLDHIYEESLEFKKIFESVNTNNLINDARLWLIFAISLSQQSQFRDANLAHRVSSKLASGLARQIFSMKPENLSIGTSVLASDEGNQDSATFRIGISDFYLPHTSYGEFCIRHREDYKTAMQILVQVGKIAPPINYTLSPMLAVTLCSQVNSNNGHFTKAFEMIASLDNHANSLRNPSFIYNQLALKCKQRLNRHCNWAGHCDYLQRVHDERQSDIEYNLIKSHILVNRIVQGSDSNPLLYKWTQTNSSNSNDWEQIFTQIDKLIEALRNCDTSCWSSYSLWNNLGVCYLMKRRYVASISCLTKARQLNPLDWRISYNLSLAYLHVGTTVRALCCSLASRKLPNSMMKISDVGRSLVLKDQIICTIIAISLSELDLKYEARRFYAELVAQAKGTRVPVMTLINYLLLLQQDDAGREASNPRVDSEDGLKCSLRLLDLFEQAWLQRAPNDAQFSTVPMDIALQVGQTLQVTKPLMKKNYAWTKQSLK